MSDLTIGAVMEVLGGEYYGGILEGIERVTRERDAQLLVFRGTPGDVAAAPFAREVRGWIAVHSPVGLAALARLGLPLVTVAYHDPGSGALRFSPTTQRASGTRCATSSLTATVASPSLAGASIQRSGSGTRVIATR
jgi:DNA-binding LacI/PurR family transcriptional regulator